MSEPGPRFQSPILAYVILQLSLCRRAKFLRLRRARSTAADISTPRGCASCAHLRGVYLSFSKAPSCQQQGERKHKHCLLPCLVLCAASSHRCICNCDCFGSLRPQLLHIAAGSESSSGDSERPFLRSSFCKGLYYSFVEALEYSVPSSSVPPNLVSTHVGSIMALSRRHRSAFQSLKTKKNVI